MEQDEDLWSPSMLVRNLSSNMTQLYKRTRQNKATVTGYRCEKQGSIPGRGKDLLFCRQVQISYQAQIYKGHLG
jgi:hypothetical protein